MNFLAYIGITLALLMLTEAQQKSADSPVSSVTGSLSGKRSPREWFEDTISSITGAAKSAAERAGKVRNTVESVKDGSAKKSFRDRLRAIKDSLSSSFQQFRRNIQNRTSISG